MKAMILAAGLGTRLRPLTDRIPKALVEIEGVTMLERVICSLKNQGFTEVVVNVHHFAEQVKDFVGRKDFGINIQISDESEELLDTGGGIVKAASLLFNKSKAVAIHNVDILSNADLSELMHCHLHSNADATLLVSDRDSSRKLVFDKDMNLRGWKNLKTGEICPEGFIPENNYIELAFSGIYIIGEGCVVEMKEHFGDSKFPIMDYFLNNRRKCIIKGVCMDSLRIIDIGKPATLSQAAGILKELD